MAFDFEFAIENEKEFIVALDRLKTKVSDLRPVFIPISLDFYRSQKSIFQLKSEGKYNPLGGFNFNAPSGFGTQTKRERAEAQKERKTGRPWFPILYGETGDLKDSTLKRSHRYSVFDMNKSDLVIGTSVPYGKFHQGDGPRSKIPQRKFIFIDGGPTSQTTGRRERWIAIIDKHIENIVKQGL